MRAMTKLLVIVATASLALAGAGCGDDGGGGDAGAETGAGDTAGGGGDAGTHEYEPFGAAHLENQLLRVGAYTDIVATRKAEGFAPSDFGGSCASWSADVSAASDPTKIGSLYVETASLAAKVEGRKDDHSYNAGAAIGVELHAAICEAIEAGGLLDPAADPDAVGGLAWQGQVIDKALLHFFYLSVFHELVLGARAKWDEAYGYFGADFDGAGDSAQGLAHTVHKRDGNCGTDYLGQLHDLFIEGRDLLDAALTAEGKDGAEEQLETVPEELQAVIDEIDGLLLEVFAISFAREWIGLEQGDDPVIKLVEGRMFFRILKPALADYDAALAADLEAQVEGDDPSQVDTTAMIDAVTAVWGLDVRNTCE